MNIKSPIIPVLTVLYLILCTPCMGMAATLLMATISPSIYHGLGKKALATFIPPWITQALQALIVAVGGLSVPIFAFALFVSSYAGQSYFDNAWDRMALRRIADTFRLVPGALAAHHARHAAYPPVLEKMDSTLAPCSSALSVMRYSRTHHIGYWKRDEEDIFHLSIKLSWDADLKYSSDVPHWIYDPGNGDPSWPIE